MVDNYERARDPKTAPELLAVLAMDNDLRIALTAVENPSMPSWALSQVVERRQEPGLVASAQAHPNWIPSSNPGVSSANKPRPSDTPPCTWKDPKTGVAYVWLDSDQDSMERGTIGVRIFCFVFDLILALIFGFIVSFLPAFLAVTTGNDDLWGPIISISFAGMFFTYWAVSYRVWGRTLAMRLGKLFVIDKTTGEYLSWGRSWIRAIVLILYIPVPFGWIIWWAVAGSTEWRQGPHDFAAKSIVVVK